MDEALYTLLSAIAPTWRLKLVGEPDTGITYQLYLGTEEAYEGGAGRGERLFYRVNVFQREYSGDVTERVKAALRGAGYAIADWEQDYIEDGRYYRDAIDAVIWRYGHD